MSFGFRMRFLQNLLHILFILISADEYQDDIKYLLLIEFSFLNTNFMLLQHKIKI